MALKPPKPPPLSDVIEQVNSLVGGSGLREEVDRSVRTLAQSALQRLDMVSREEFDVQAEALTRTRARVAELEAELDTLTREIAALEQRSDNS
jgi:BMFP domain-containing protein YqiC